MAGGRKDKVANLVCIHHKLMQGGTNSNHHVGLADILYSKLTFKVINEVVTERSESERCSSIPNKNTVFKGKSGMRRLQLKSKMIGAID